MKSKRIISVIISVLALVLVLVISLKSNLFSGHDLSYETICAVIGVILTGVVTGVLLNGQSEQEEKKEKKSKRYSEKLHIYHDFLKELCSVIKDRKITDEEVIELQFQVSYLAMHSDEKSVTAVSSAVKDIITCLRDENRNDNNFLESLFEIVRILRGELYDLSDDGNSAAAFDDAIANFTSITVSSNNNVQQRTIYDRIIELKQAAKGKLGCNRQWVYNYHTLVHECYVGDTSLSCDTVFEPDGSVTIQLFLRNGDIAGLRTILGDTEIWGDKLSVYDSQRKGNDSLNVMTYRCLQADEADVQNLLPILEDITDRMKRTRKSIG